MYRTLCTVFTTLIAIALTAGPVLAQGYRAQVRRGLLQPMRPMVVAPAANPYLPIRNYPLATPASIWAQAAVTQANAQAAANAFTATTWAMATQGNANPYSYYYPYSYNPYYPYYYNPYYYNPYSSPVYTNPYYSYSGGGYGTPYYGGYSAPSYGSSPYGSAPTYDGFLNATRASSGYNVPPYSGSGGQAKQPSALTAFGIPSENNRVKWPLAFRLMPPEKKRELLEPLEAQLQIVTAQAVSGKANPILVKEAEAKVAALRQWLRSRRLEVAEAVFNDGDALLRQIDAALEKMRAEY